jgi:CheY-like chemotaxis protein
MASRGLTPDQERRVLVVDDDDLVREMAVDLLRESGFTAIAARTADEALALLSGVSVPFQSLLMDMIMPGTNPLDAMGEISRQYPDLQVILMSGEDLPNDCIVLLQESGVRFLYKADLLTDLIPMCNLIRLPLGRNQVQSGL